LYVCSLEELSQLEYGSTVLERENFDLSALAVTLVDKYKLSFEKKKIQLLPLLLPRQLPERPYFQKADQDTLLFLQNSMKKTPAGYVFCQPKTVN
jgi:signal transduction histidine kinase